MAKQNQFEITVGGKPVSPEVKKRVNEALVKTLHDQLVKEGLTLGGIAGAAKGHSSGITIGHTESIHGNVKAPTEPRTTLPETMKLKTMKPKTMKP